MGVVSIRLRALSRIVLGATCGHSHRELTFLGIYQDKIWGSLGGERFFSGPGSLPENLGPYHRIVSEFIRAHDVHMVVDLGCGDFRASREIDLGGASYTGVDIVSQLVDHNRRCFSNDRVRFERRDLLADPLPAGDLCLIKHVLQHWSNTDILAFLPKLRMYRYALILNGRFCFDRDPSEVNEDIVTGEGFRQTGLDLVRPPFNLKVELLLTWRSTDSSEEFCLVRYDPSLQEREV